MYVRAPYRFVCVCARVSARVVFERERGSDCVTVCVCVCEGGWVGVREGACA